VILERKGVAMARGEQLARQWQLIQILIASKRGKSVSDLADGLNCIPRTVYRDLEALQFAGFPIYNQKKAGKNLWHLLDTPRDQIPLPLTLTELMALYFSRDMLKILKDTVFYNSLASLFQKIKTTLPLNYQKNLDRIEKTLIVGPRPYKPFSQYKEIIDGVNRAIDRQHHIEILYFTMSRNEQTWREVAPYKVWFFDGTFYLIGFCCLRREIRIFALDRITQLRQTDLPYEMPADFNIEEYMRTSFGVFHGKPIAVRVKFSAAVAGYIQEKVWHGSQKIEQHADGAITFEVQVAGTQEIKFWIMRWGAQAVVLSPESLKDEILAEARQIIGTYQNAADDPALEKTKSLR
jgi:predicted DNA-binding transcriptional regulator YafY